MKTTTNLFEDEPIFKLFYNEIGVIEPLPSGFTTPFTDIFLKLIEFGEDNLGKNKLYSIEDAVFKTEFFRSIGSFKSILWLSTYDHHFLKAVSKNALLNCFLDDVNIDSTDGCVEFWNKALIMNHNLKVKNDDK